ncbi:MAG: response regulator [Candidatus Promineifilaceae bacterium]
MATSLIQRILAEKERSNRVQLFIVGEDNEVAAFLKKNLSLLYQVDVVEYGKDVLAALEQDTPGFLIVSSTLPDMDFLTLLQVVRNHRNGRLVPIIVLGQPEDTRERKLAALELDIDDYITKPFDIDELRYRIRNTLPNPHQSADLITGLPGWLAAEFTLSHLMTEHHWTVMLVRVNHLRPYRQVYGFLAGNTALRTVSQLLEAAVSRFGKYDDFIGYLGEEDFLILTTSPEARELSMEIRHLFHKELPVFYTPPDLTRKWIQIENKEPVPLMSIAIGMVNAHHQSFSSPLEAIEAAENTLLGVTQP